MCPYVPMFSMWLKKRITMMFHNVEKFVQLIIRLSGRRVSARVFRLKISLGRLIAEGKIAAV